MATSRRRLCCCACVSLLAAAAVLVVCVALLTKDEPHCRGDAAWRAAVAADTEMCSRVGSQILQDGGSAVDGAIAALLCTSLMNPQSAGVGGGSILTVLEKSGQVKTIFSRETAPKNVSADLLDRCPRNFTPQWGSHWIGVPGEIRGYELAHRLYGKLPWAKLFEPTIKLARNGVPVSPYLANILRLLQAFPFFTNNMCDLFCHKNKTVFGHGDIMRFPVLANTLQAIAEKGANAFYEGQIALDLIDDIKTQGGTLTMEDLRAFDAKATDSWSVSLGDYKMSFPPPPAGGATLSFILNIMKGYNLSASSIEGDKRALTYHRYVEALKFANGQRRNIRDPKFHAQEEAENLITDQFADRIRALINDTRTHESSYYQKRPTMDSFGTTHVSVLAADGMAVSATSTINQIFGSMLYSPKTGVILNNELADFCGSADHISAGERPPSSMAPAILHSKSKQRTVAIGGAGGMMITTAMAMSIMNYVWFEKNLTEAIKDPILYVDAKNTVNPEKTFDKDVMAKLKTLGHSEGDWPYFLNVVNAVAKEGSCISAVSDSRKLGKAVGY